MEFYKIWRARGGTIGVNKMSLNDMIRAEITIVIMYVILLALFVTVLPTLLFGFYMLWMITSDSNEGYDGRASEQRLVINILTVISSLYFLLDFHFGWIAFSIFGGICYAETYDSVAIYNTTIGLLSILYFFVGHELYRAGENRLVRIGVFLLFTYLAFNFCTNISAFIVNNIVTQCVDEDIEEARSKLTESTYDIERDNEKYDRWDRKRQERIDKYNEPGYFSK